MLRSPAAIYAALTMAHDEMVTIRDLNVDLLNEHKHRLWLYFAETDGWVGKSREEVTKACDFDPASIRVVHGEADIPHAFCISASGIFSPVAQWTYLFQITVELLPINVFHGWNRQIYFEHLLLRVRRVEFKYFGRPCDSVIRSAPLRHPRCQAQHGA